LHVQETVGGQSRLYRRYNDVRLRRGLVDRVAIDTRVGFIGKRINFIGKTVE
jgi:hypothetical protein